MNKKDVYAIIAVTLLGFALAWLNAQTVGDVDIVGQSDITPQQFGAIEGGTVDCTTAIQSAINAADDVHPVFLPAGDYLISSSITIGAAVDGIRIYGAGRGVSRLVVAQNGFNDAVLQVNADDCVFEDFSIEETSSSPTNAKKSNSANVAIDVDGASNIFRNLFIDGFGFCAVLRDNDADGSSDHNRFENCEFQNAYAWGFEIDGSRNVQVIRCDSHGNGLDGYKVQNEHSRTSEGFRFESCNSYSNGQRDSEAGGSESTNGNGLDLFDGGHRGTITNCRFYSNYGSGLVIKGAAPQPAMGELQVIGCQAFDNLSTSGGVSHGYELNQGGVHAGSFISFTSCLAKGNTGDGFAVFGGSGNIFTSCLSITNRHEFNLQAGSDITLVGCNALGASIDGHCIRIGNSNSGAYTSRRITIIGGLLSGQYDPDLADGDDYEDADTAILANRGINISSDSADVLIDGVSFGAFELYSILTLGDRVAVRNCRFIETPELGILNNTGAGDITVSDCFFGNALQELTFSSGDGTEPSPGDAVSGSSSSATGVIKRVEISSGSFAGGDAAGVFQVGNTSGLFTTSDTLNLPSSTTAAVDTRDDYRAIRILAGRGKVEDCEFELENNRADGDAIYIDSTAADYRVAGNQFSNIVDEITVEAGAVIIGQATASDADATPTVLGTTVLLTANSGGTTITDFDDAIEGQDITVIIDGNTTVQDNANIELAGGLDFSDAQGGSIKLISIGGVWEEVSRTGF